MLLFVTVFIFYMSTTHAQYSSPLTEYIEVPGKYVAPIPPHSLQVKKGISLRMCAAQCTLDFRMKRFPCYAFEYTPGSQMCVHTNVTSLVVNGGYLGLKSNAAVNYYERSKVSYSNLFHGIPNAALKDERFYYTVKLNKTLEECAYACLTSTSVTCMSFSFSTSGACGLSRAFYQAGQQDVALQSSTIYTHYQYFTRWPCNATLHENYAPKVFASLRFPYHSIRHADCYAKLEAPRGKQVHLSLPVVFFEQDACAIPGNSITVYDGRSSNGKVLGKYCSTTHDKANPPEVVSTSGSLYVHYQAKDVALAFESMYQFVTINPCETQPCVNGATCVANNSSYACVCPTGYTGQNCETNIDECSSSPCYFGGTCIDQVGGYQCICSTEFRGSRCQEFVGACAKDPCIHGTCAVASRYNYTCNCETGYTGRHCDQVATPCMSNPCSHGNCHEIGDNYVCQCENGYKGTQCDVLDFCALNPCGIHGNCSMTSSSSIVCTCESGYGGHYCEHEINPCLNVNCNHGTCDQSSGRCICHTGVKGQVCDDVSGICTSIDCGQGHCYPYPGFKEGFVCYCQDGRYSSYCNYTIDACASSPCVNGSCINKGPNGYTCNCSTKYTGNNCDKLITCIEANCGSGLCMDSADGYSCLCPVGYTGTNCQRHDTTVPPSTPGTCNLPCQNGVCAHVNQSYLCVCNASWTGDLCQHYTYNPSGGQGHCSSSLCPRNATCTEQHSGYFCTCPVNTSGGGCFPLNHPCATNPCPEGSCMSNDNLSYRCVVWAIQSTGNTSANSSVTSSQTVTSPDTPVTDTTTKSTTTIIIFGQMRDVWVRQSVR